MNTPSTTPPVAAVVTALLADGWREYPDQFKTYAHCLYKRFDTPSVCQGNADKRGMQIEIAVCEGFAGTVSMELTLSGGLKDGTWIKVLNYALPKTVEQVTALVPRMLALWEAANGANP